MAVSLEFGLEEIDCFALRYDADLQDLCSKIQSVSSQDLLNNIAANAANAANAASIKFSRAWLGFYAVLPEIILNMRQRGATKLILTYVIDPHSCSLTIDCVDNSLILPKASWLRPLLSNRNNLFSYYDLLAGRVASWDQAQRAAPTGMQKAMLLNDRYYFCLALMVAFIGSRAGDWGAVSLKFIEGEGLLLRIAAADVLANDHFCQERYAALSDLFAQAPRSQSAWVGIINRYRHGDPGRFI